MATPCLRPEVVDKELTVPFIIQTRTLLRGKGGAINNFPQITAPGDFPRQTGMNSYPIHGPVSCLHRPHFTQQPLLLFLYLKVFLYSDSFYFHPKKLNVWFYFPSSPPHSSLRGSVISFCFGPILTASQGGQFVCH